MSDYLDIHADIDNYDVFCFDIFDTAIIRLFDKPTDVFRFISLRHGIPTFYDDRINREVKTRKELFQKRDVSIYEIYRDFPYDIRHEIAAELAYCVANPEIQRIYEKVICAGKKVFFISDMYLTKDVLQKILLNSGYDKYEDIFVSSEDDLIKGDGSRFIWLKSQPDFADCNLIHIGDNYVSDYLKPLESGFRSLHYKDKRHF